MPTTEKDFNALKFAFENQNTEDVKKILENFDFTATDKSGWTGLLRCCQTHSEHIPLFIEKIVESGGSELLLSQLTATNGEGWTCLMLCCCYSQYPEVMKLLLKKIMEVGGPDFLLGQLSATNCGGWTSLMYGCSCSGTPEVLKLVFERIDEVGGEDLLRKQLAVTNNNGVNCLAASFQHSSSPEVLKLVCENIFSLGRRYLREEMKLSCLGLVLSRPLLDSKSESEILNLLVSLYSMAGTFGECYSQLDEGKIEILRRVCNIRSAEWSRRAQASDSPFGDLIGEIKKSIKNKN